MRKGMAEVVASASVVAAAAEGGRHGPRDPKTAAWYATLRKPAWAPPGAVIGVVWASLDGLLCFTGTRLLAAPPSPARRAALAGWATDVGGLALYPWLFFGRRRLDLGLAASAAMIAGAATTVVAARRVDRAAARASLPLLAWLGLAGSIGFVLWRDNR